MWTEATNLLSLQWLGRTLECDAQVSNKVKFDSIKHQHMLCRCYEEIAMLRRDESELSLYLKDWRELNNVGNK